VSPAVAATNVDNQPHIMVERLKVHCIHFNNEMLREVLSLACICKSDIDLAVTNTKATNPGKTKEECNWPEWEKVFINYLLVILGVNDIPLPLVTVANLRYQLNTSGISFSVAANHINSKVSTTPDYQMTRKIAAMYTGGSNTGRS
jgi:hypothetical protein